MWRLTIFFVLQTFWCVDASTMPMAVTLTLETITRCANETLGACACAVLACPVVLTASRTLSIVASDSGPSNVAGAGEVDTLRGERREKREREEKEKEGKRSE